MEKNETKNKDKYVLITGATGGLGRAFCFELAKQNYNLFLTGTTEEKLKKLKSEILSSYPNLKIKYLPCDLSDYDSRINLLNYIDSNNIIINFLINNAGYITEGSIKNADIHTLLKCIQVNCEGTIHITKALLDSRVDSERFDIINITSMAGNYPMPYMAIYSATKALLNNFMTSLKYEYRKDNVNMLIVEPGAIATSQDMKDAIKAQGLKGKLSSVAPEKIAKNAIKLSLKRKSRYIPGLFNKLTIFSSKLISTKMQTRIIAKMWRKSQEKRNIK